MFFCRSFSISKNEYFKYSIPIIVVGSIYFFFKYSTGYKSNSNSLSISYENMSNYQIPYIKHLIKYYIENSKDKYSKLYNKYLFNKKWDLDDYVENVIELCLNQFPSNPLEKYPLLIDINLFNIKINSGEWKDKNINMIPDGEYIYLFNNIDIFKDEFDNFGFQYDILYDNNISYEYLMDKLTVRISFLNNKFNIIDNYNIKRSIINNYNCVKLKTIKSKLKNYSYDTEIIDESKSYIEISKNTCLNYINKENLQIENSINVENIKESQNHLKIETLNNYNILDCSEYNKTTKYLIEILLNNYTIISIITEI